MVRLGLASDLYNCDMWDNLLTSDPRLEKLSNNLKRFYEGKRGSKNLIIFDDNLICIWDNQDQHFFCLLVRDNKLINIQSLIPTNAPLFDVDSLVLSPDGRHLALQGSRGINIMELPRKFGSLNAYEGGKNSILCRTVRLAERFFVCNQKISVLESRWHPGSQTGSHIAVLTNDDTIRIYDVTHPQICFQEINLSSSSDLEQQRYSKFALSLGQIGVSFDFGLPIIKRKLINQSHSHAIGFTDGNNSNLIAINTSSTTASQSDATAIDEDSFIWPIYVLRGNGDVLLVYSDLSNIYLSKKILGPLTMRPSAEDNYGVDASSIICLDCAPTLLVIATSSGILYHCLALDAYEDRRSTSVRPDELALTLYGSSSTLISHESDQRVNQSDGQLSNLFINPPTLFVLESLELVLSLTSIVDQEISSPLRLHKASSNPQVYFVSHEAGVHIVNIPFINRLRSNDTISLDETEQSIIEHLICTKPISSLSSSVPSSIPLGIALVSHRGFFSVSVLLSSGEILAQRLSSIHFDSFGLSQEPEPKANIDAPVSFAVYINQILKRSMNAPHIKSETNKEPSKADCLQMLLNTTDILRKEYLARMEKASEVMIKRASTLVSNKDLQLEEIQKLQKEKDDIIAKINVTSTRFDEALERQEKLSQRIEKVLEAMQYSQNHLSEAEAACQKELEEIARSMDKYHNRLDQVSLKFKYQQELKEKDLIEGSAGDDMVPKRSAVIVHQVMAVKKILTSQSEAIQQLVSQVNALKKHSSQIKLLT